MKTYRFLCIIAGAALLSACTDKENEIGGPVAATIQAGISTRATVDDTWTAGEDAIGVYVTSAEATKGSNVKYVTSDQAGSFSPAGEPIYFADEDNAVFCAYYPYTDDSEIDPNGRINWQGGYVKDGKCDRDFLFATGATARKSSPVVNFTGDKAFRHCMAMVTFNIKAGAGIDIENNETLIDFKLNNIHNDGTVDPKNGEVALYAMKTSLTGTVNKKLYDRPTVSFILLPQVVQDNDISITLETLTAAGTPNTYTTTLTAPSGGRFNGGSRYSYTIVVTNTGINIGDTSIISWENGASGDLNIDA